MLYERERVNYYNLPSRKDNSKARKAPKPIGGVIEKVVKSLGISKSYHGWLVVSKWSDIVGDQIAKVAKAVRFDDGTLYVAVPDAAWRQNLAMETEVILHKIQSYPFGCAVRRLRFVQGEKGL